MPSADRHSRIACWCSAPIPARRHSGDVKVNVRVCVCVRVCVICTIYEVDPYAAMRWQVYSAQFAVASLRL